MGQWGRFCDEKRSKVFASAANIRITAGVRTVMRMADQLARETVALLRAFDRLRLDPKTLMPLSASGIEPVNPPSAFGSTSGMPTRGHSLCFADWVAVSGRRS
jgi:hypothetical protein